MSRQKIIITLSLKDQKFLEQLLSKGTAPARTIRRAQILLNSNRKGKKQYTAEELADLLSTKKQTVSRVLKEYELYLWLGNISVYNRNCNNVFCY